MRQVDVDGNPIEYSVEGPAADYEADEKASAEDSSSYAGGGRLKGNRREKATRPQ